VTSTINYQRILRQNNHKSFKVSLRN